MVRVATVAVADKDSPDQRVRPDHQHGKRTVRGRAQRVGHLKQTPIRYVHTGEERLSEQVRITPLHEGSKLVPDG